MLLTHEQVLNFLPHRRPFLFIDTVESITLINEESFKETLPQEKDLLGCSVVAHFHVKEDLEILRGHFPGRPILPGVVQVEMMAQAACFSIHRTFPKDSKPHLEVALLAVNESKFRKPVVPGMDLVIYAACTKVRGKMIGYDCHIKHNDQLISEAALLASLIKKGDEPS